jgi:hypothetical protein
VKNSGPRHPGKVIVLLAQEDRKPKIIDNTLFARYGLGMAAE